MKQKHANIIMVIIMTGMYAFSFPNIEEFFPYLPSKHLHLWTAIAASVLGVIIYLFKHKRISTEMRTTAELFEILMFMIIPAFALYEILDVEIKTYPLIIPIVFLSTISAWFGISEYLIRKKFETDKGDLVKHYVRSFSFFMLGIGSGLSTFMLTLHVK